MSNYMHVKEYLAGLDLDQLRFAERESGRRIKEIEDQKKVTIWAVGGAIDEVYFTEDTFDKAKAKVCEMIMSEEFGPDSVNSINHPVITKIRAYESEIEEWMRLNK